MKAPQPPKGGGVSPVQVAELGGFHAGLASELGREVVGGVEVQAGGYLIDDAVAVIVVPLTSNCCARCIRKRRMICDNLRFYLSIRH